MVAVFEFNAIFGTCSRIPTIQKLLKYGDEDDDAMMKLTVMMTMMMIDHVDDDDLRRWLQWFPASLSLFPPFALYSLRCLRSY